MKIIFVDDSQIVLDTLKSLVQDMIDTQMITCEFLNDSTLVKKLLTTEKLEYNVMFVDINMPNVSGYDLAKCAKNINKYKYKSIIAITSEYNTEAKKQGSESGIDGWFVKSITQDSLQTSIVEIIKQLYKK